MNKRVEDLLNEQVNKEFYSAYLYLSMSSYFSKKNLNGFANFMRVQYQEEVSHGMKIFDYIMERGGRAKLKPIGEVKLDWKDVIEVFEETCDHEKFITDSINNIVDISYEEKDHATVNMLQWFVKEQVEEEATAQGLLEQLKMIDGKGAGIFMIDRELMARTFVDSTQEA
ncbi:ferritin [uncultured Ilyobacter sp.]|uniref:ferritin n=1 Tax=uncultured Ilyobacter sp. TaxID=544433 RepID=UPI0029F51C2B|nr:ferritin [uncultured Ilyobacter sp.]